MGKKSKKRNFYSTDPNWEPYEEEEDMIETLPPQQQKLRIKKDRRKGGKVVTLVTAYIGDEADLKDLGKTLKTKCGGGGTVKEGEIILQGDHVDKVVTWLKEMGYSQTKRSGG
jgi:translation initiation factor 1